jgi:hypothetical protein
LLEELPLIEVHDSWILHQANLNRSLRVLTKFEAKVFKLDENVLVYLILVTSRVAGQIFNTMESRTTMYFLSISALSLMKVDVVNKFGRINSIDEVVVDALTRASSVKYPTLVSQSRRTIIAIVQISLAR